MIDKNQKQWVNSWLHNEYGLTDDSLLNAGECEEMCEMIVYKALETRNKELVELGEGLKKDTDYGTMEELPDQLIHNQAIESYQKLIQGDEN